MPLSALLAVAARMIIIDAAMLRANAGRHIRLFTCISNPSLLMSVQAYALPYWILKRILRKRQVVIEVTAGQSETNAQSHSKQQLARWMLGLHWRAFVSDDAMRLQFVAIF